MRRRMMHISALLAFAFFSVSFASAQGVTIYALSSDDNSIRRLDIIAGSLTSAIPISVLGKTVVSSHGFARDPHTGTVYALVEFADSEPGIRSLISVDLNNGAGSVIGPVDDGSGISIGAITVTGSGMMLGISDLTSASKPGMLFMIDKQTGVAASLMPLTVSDAGQSLAFDPDNGLVYIVTGGSDLVVQSLDPALPEAGTTHFGLGYASVEPTSLLHVGASRFVFSTMSGDLYLLNTETRKFDHLSSPGLAAGLIAVPTGSCPPGAALYGAGPLEGPQFLTAIDQATGSTSLIGAIGFNDITGLSFAPDGALYAVGTREDGSGVAVLLTIDPCTGKGTEVGPTGTPLRDLRIQSDGTGLTYSASMLSQLNRTTATVTPIGDSGIFVDDFGISFSTVENKLYFASIFNGNGDLFSIDRTTGASTFEAQLTAPPYIGALRAMDFDTTTNQMYALVSEGGQSAPTYLSVVDTAAHSVSLVGPTSTNMRTLAFRAGSTSSDYLLTLIKEGEGDGAVTSSPIGIDCGSTCDFAFPSGTQVTLTALAQSGSVFAGWSGACSGVGTCVISMDAVRTVRAAFTAAPRFTLTVSKNGNGAGLVVSDLSGIDCGSACAANFPSDTAVILNATPDPGSSFAGWTGACSGHASCQVTMSTNLAVTATFNQLPTFPLVIHIANTGAGVVTAEGINCSTASCSSSFAEGTGLTLSASANPEWTFAGWSGSCTGTGTCSVTMDSAKDVTANFSFVGPFKFPSSAPAPATISAGQSAVFNIPLQAHSAGNATLVLSCSGLPFGAACSFNPNNIPLTAGTNSAIATQLTISTTAPTLASATPNTGGASFGLGVLAMTITCRRRRNALLLGTGILCLLLLPSCGGGGGGPSGTVTKLSQSGTPVGTYTITVTGTAGSTAKSTTVTLVVK